MLAATAASVLSRRSGQRGRAVQMVDCTCLVSYTGTSGAPPGERFLSHPGSRTGQGASMRRPSAPRSASEPLRWRRNAPTFLQGKRKTNSLLSGTPRTGRREKGRLSEQPKPRPFTWRRNNLPPGSHSSAGGGRMLPAPRVPQHAGTSSGCRLACDNPCGLLMGQK